jgi:hypothetical protein
MRVASMLAIVGAILTPAPAQTYIGASACGRRHLADFARNRRANMRIHFTRQTNIR